MGNIPIVLFIQHQGAPVAPWPFRLTQHHRATLFLPGCQIHLRVQMG